MSYCNYDGKSKDLSFHCYISVTLLFISAFLGISIKAMHLSGVREKKMFGISSRIQVLGWEFKYKYG